MSVEQRAENLVDVVKTYAYAIALFTVLGADELAEKLFEAKLRIRGVNYSVWNGGMDDSLGFRPWRRRPEYEIHHEDGTHEVIQR